MSLASLHLSTITPEFRYGLSDPALLRIGSGDIARMSYTLTIEDRQDSFNKPDTHFFKSGQTYVMDLRPPKCRWAYEDELLRTDLNGKRLKELLELLSESQFNSSCRLNQKVVRGHSAEGTKITPWLVLNSYEHKIKTWLDGEMEAKLGARKLQVKDFAIR
jgi:hypothetical protein